MANDANPSDGAEMTIDPRPRLIRGPVVSPSGEAELEGVLRLVNSRLVILPTIARFETAPMRNSPHLRTYHTQIRAVPQSGRERVEFRYDMHLEDPGRGSVEDIAWNVLGMAYRFLQPNQHVQWGELARRTIEPIVAAGAGGSIGLNLLAFGVAYDFVRESPQFCVDLEMLGDDLVLGIERMSGRDVDHLAREVTRAIEDHRARADARVRARGSLASGWISQAALRIVDSAGLDRRGMIELVHKDRFVEFSFYGPNAVTFEAGLLHSNGVIEGRIMPRDRSWSLKEDHLIIRGEGIPEVLRSSMTGRRVGDLFQNRELPEDAVITSREEATSVDPESDDDETDGWLRLLIAIPLVEIDEVTGDAREPGGGRRSGPDAAHGG